MLRTYEQEGNLTARLAMLEETKNLPSGAVWGYYCHQQDVPLGPAWLKEVASYEQRVLSRRDARLIERS